MAKDPTIVDAGRGVPVVLVPGVQGRWEWMRPAVTALSTRCRVVTYSLAGEPGSGLEVSPATSFDVFVSQLDDVIRRRGLERPAICGVSYGGFIAARYAARWPERVSSLILASAPAPPLMLDDHTAFYCRKPWLGAPLFCLRAFGRLVDELAATFPSRSDRWRFMLTHLATLARAPMSPPRASQRALLAQQVDLVGDCRRLAVPVLLVTGEQGLDRVVPPSWSLRYRSLIEGTEHAVLERTGHLGLITRPDRFADLVCEFAGRHRGTPRSEPIPAPEPQVGVER